MIPSLQKVRLSAILVVCICAAGCAAAIRLDENLDDYRAEVADLERELLSNPGNLGALQDLGVIYVRTGHPEVGGEILQRAHDLGDLQPRTLLYLGLAYEGQGMLEEALGVYESYALTPRRSPYRNPMEGRYAWVTRELARQEVRERLALEAEVADLAVSPDVVAVFPLTYQGSNPQYAPLGRGLAEMISVDLGQVTRLRIVERVRLQALRDELALAATDYVDRSTAPRMGRLLQAGIVVSGSYNVVGDEDLRLDAALVESATSTVNELDSETAALRGFFDLEKRIVFSVLDELGIELTAAERVSIESIPTQNLQAFLAFSRGLIAEDEENYGAAAIHFQQAGQLDPGFSAAATRGEGAALSAGAAGTPTAFMGETGRLEPPSRPPIDLLGHRTRRLGQGLSAPLLPGPESRGGATEQAAGTMAPPGRLPDPPRPPGGG